MRSYTVVFNCSTVDKLVPRLQQSWCSTGKGSAEHAERKYLFPWRGSHLCHRDNAS